MNKEVIHIEEASEFNLIDALVILAESWKLLVYGPLSASLIVCGLSYLWPNTYESQSIVRMTEAELALINTTTVQDKLIEKFDLMIEFEGKKNKAIEYLEKNLGTKFDKKTGMAIISARATEPKKAQDLCIAAINVILNELLPKGKDKELIEKQILINEKAIQDYIDATELLKNKLNRAGNEIQLEIINRTYTEMMSEIGKKEIDTFKLRESLIVKKEEVYVQRPNLPNQKIPIKHGLIFLLTLLVSSLVIVAFVFIRRTLVVLAQDLKSLDKIVKNKNSLTLKNN